MEEYLCWHLPIFPGSHPPSIFGTIELNFRVRYGNGWTLNVIDTNYAKTVFAVLYPVYFIFADGDSCGNRTRVAGVRGRSLDRLTNEPHLWLGGHHPDLLALIMVHHQGLEPWTP